VVNDNVTKKGIGFKGKIDGKIIKEHIVPAPDKTNHLIGLAEGNGHNKSIDGDPFMDNAEVKTVEQWDLVDGAGSDHGYWLMKLGDNVVVARYSGKAKIGEGNRFELTGKLLFVSGSGRFNGITGQASYSGWALSNDFELIWRGRYVLPD